MELRRKVIGVPLQKAMTSEDGSMLVLGKFTSDQKDEVGDIITRSATERALPKYKRWGNIRYMHMPKPVGKVSRIGVEDGLEWNEVEIKVIDPQAKFEVETGLLQALSVGILIDINGIEMLEDGGWIINDYQLAEISLVDHPANYDAALETLNLSIDASLRDKIREQGVVPVLRSIGAFPAQEGEPMEKDITPAVAEAVEQPVTEVPAEDAPVVEEEVKEIATEAPVVEEVSAEVPAEEAPVAEAVEDPALAVLNSLKDLVVSMQRQLEELVAKDAPEPKADVESVSDAKDISGEDVRVAQLEAKVADLSSKLEALSTPVDRKGALPVEDLAAETAPEPEQEQPKKLSLKDAVREHMRRKMS